MQLTAFGLVTNVTNSVLFPKHLLVGLSTYPIFFQVIVVQYFFPGFPDATSRNLLLLFRRLLPANERRTAFFLRGSI